MGRNRYDPDLTVLDDVPHPVTLPLRKGLSLTDLGNVVCPFLQ